MSRVVVTKMKTQGIAGKVKAYFSISLGSIEVEDLRLIDGRNGLFISFPSKKISKAGEEDKYVDIVRLSRDKEGKFTTNAQSLYDDIFEAAKKEYERREGATTSAAESTDDEVDDLPF